MKKVKRKTESLLNQNLNRLLNMKKFRYFSLKDQGVVFQRYSSASVKQSSQSEE